ncbi:MAG: serine/threonine-protein phosphatase [Planctomycetaceae bacterium]|nr:serine/threonine-protein phosphatase [Planctomycetaceae bacterium]
MAGKLQLEWGSVSITGNFRENNEDNCFVDPDGRYFLVADGMGGQSAGEKASQLAIELVSERLNKSLDFSSDDPAKIIPAIDNAVSHANGEIMALGELDPSYHNMGTTIVFVTSVNSTLYIGGVGDSRVYLLRDGKLKQLTKDHSLTQALIEAGTISAEEATTHRYKNVLYRYLGTKEGSNGTEPKRITPQTGDRLMLCSDGVTDGLDDGAISHLLAGEDDPQQAAATLVSAAEAGGSKDNITCVVIHVK